MHRAITDFSSLICSSQAMQRTPAHALGCFKLQPHHALTLTVRAPGELRIAHGQVWLTLANAAHDASVRAGDHFLHPGEALQLDSGQTLVMEALDSRLDEAVYFSWEPNAALSAYFPVSLRRLQQAHEVRQPLLDMGEALLQAGRAFGRLVRGVASNLACALMVRRSTP